MLAIVPSSDVVVDDKGYSGLHSCLRHSLLVTIFLEHQRVLRGSRSALVLNRVAIEDLASDTSYGRKTFFFWKVAPLRMKNMM